MKKRKKERINFYVELVYYKNLKSEARETERSASWLLNEILRERYEVENGKEKQD